MACSQEPVDATDFYIVEILTCLETTQQQKKQQQQQKKTKQKNKTKKNYSAKWEKKHFYVIN